jgi:all-trans-retinol dehydrogenase (NAD+)
MIILNLCILAFFSILLLYYLIEKIREKKFKNQTYITKNSLILITGGCLGIGREIIHQLISKYKCKIINLDIRKEEFNNIKNEYKEKIINIYCDLNKEQNFENLLLENKIKINEINILINNAGIAFNLPFEKLSKEQIKSTIQINLISPMLLTKLLISKKEENKILHIITMASIMSHITSKNSSDYTSSKWGLYGFHESLRSEYLYRKDICFTIFCPYFINSGMFPNFKNPLPFILKIYDVKNITYEIIKCIILKDKIVFFPKYSYIICFIAKFIPCFLMDFIQYYIFDYAIMHMGSRKDNNKLLNLK